MTNRIGRRLDRLETDVQKKTDPGYGPVFELIDDPHDPENSKRIQGAVRFKRDNPTGLIIHRIILRPPNGEPNWRPYIEAGSPSPDRPRAIIGARGIAVENGSHARRSRSSMSIPISDYRYR
jgi:hypothetical protein